MPGKYSNNLLYSELLGRFYPTPRFCFSKKGKEQKPIADKVFVNFGNKGFDSSGLS